MEFNGINFDTYFNNYPDKDGYFGKYGGVYVDDKLKAAMAEKRGKTALAQRDMTDKRDRMADPRVLWGVRAVILAVGILFVVLGILNGGMADVLGKAVRICTECIGLG